MTQTKWVWKPNYIFVVKDEYFRPCSEALTLVLFLSVFSCDRSRNPFSTVTSYHIFHELCNCSINLTTVKSCSDPKWSCTKYTKPEKNILEHPFKQGNRYVQFLGTHLVLLYVSPAQVNSWRSEGWELKIYAFVCLSNIFPLFWILQFRTENVTVIKKLQKCASYRDLTVAVGF